MRLKDISDIKFGFHDIPKEKGEAIYLQARNFNQFGRLTNELISYINIHQKNQGYILKDGDILLAGKGTRNFGWCYRKDLGVALASSIFFVIRPNQEFILPEYLAAVFNLPQSQSHFQQLGAGSSMQSIRKNELAEFKVPVLSMEEQKKMVQITELHHQELKLLNSLMLNKKGLYKSLITKMIN